MREVLEHFREWYANHFDDFSPEVNSELLSLDNEAAEALSVDDRKDWVTNSPSSKNAHR